MAVFLPICSNKHSPLYHFVSSLDWDLVIRFSPLRPLVGIKATSLSYKKDWTYETQYNIVFKKLKGSLLA